VNVARSACQCAYDVSGWFLPVNDKIAKGSCCAALFLRTVAALRDRGGIDVALPTTIQTTVMQRFSLGAVIGVFRWCVPKLVACEVSTRLMTTINDGYVGLDVSR
jgi:hypothetical protein